MAKVSATTRWDLVAERERDELMRMSLEEKLTRVAALMQSVDAMGWADALQREDEAVWMRWQAIRAAWSRR